MLSEGSPQMKMCFKLAYCAFSSPPSIDATMSAFGFFSSLFVEVLNLLMSFSPAKT